MPSRRCHRSQPAKPADGWFLHRLLQQKSDTGGVTALQPLPCRCLQSTIGSPVTNVIGCGISRRSCVPLPIVVRRRADGILAELRFRLSLTVTAFQRLALSRFAGGPPVGGSAGIRCCRKRDQVAKTPTRLTSRRCRESGTAASGSRQRRAPRAP